MIAIDPGFYFETLYPFQDRVLQAITDLDTGFYLSGGTAASRGYLNHRFSDDLDLFVDGKAAGVFPVDLARLLLSATSADWEQVRWITAPPADQFLSDLRYLGERLILV